MSPESQRIAIAEACGWKFVGEQPLNRDPDFHFWVRPGRPNYRVEQLPDFARSLDLMHEVEATIAEEDAMHFMNEHLYEIVPPNERPWHASASQRAEAFLKALNLWTE